VAGHLLPFHPDGGPLRAVAQRLEGRNRDALELAFARQTAAHDGAVGLQVLAPIQVHHVVKVTRPLALCQGVHLLGKDFLERVTENVDDFVRQVAAG